MSGSRWHRPPRPRPDPHDIFFHYYEHECLDQCRDQCLSNSHGHGHGHGHWWRQTGENPAEQLTQPSQDYHYYDDQSAEHFNSYDGRERKNRDGRILLPHRPHSRILDLLGGVVGGGLNVAGSAAAAAGALAAGGGRITAEFVKILLDTIANLVPLPAINLKLPMPEPRTEGSGRNNRSLFFKGTVVVLVTIKVVL